MFRHCALITLGVFMACSLSTPFLSQESWADPIAQPSAESPPLNPILRRTALGAHEVMGRGGMVVSDNSTASEVGVQVLREGGDAVDAAVATALMLGVLQPFASGIGGGGFAVLHRASEQRAYTLDFREIAPAQAHADMYLDAQGEPIPALSTVGALAAGVPGEIAGLYTLHQRHGKLPWARLVMPALKAARDGFPMHRLLHDQVTVYLNRVKASTSLSAHLLDADGRPRALGSLIRFPELAWTLERVARSGMSGFYQGEVAVEIARAVGAAGGIITVDDLKRYQPKERAALQGTYRGYKLITMPPPSSGGAIILQALRSLELTLYPQTPERLGRDSALYVHALTESLKHGFADRARFMGDPDFTPVPIPALLSPERIQRIADTFKPNQTHPRAAYGGAYQPTPDGGTSHFNVLDSEGNAVALTTTINTGFGSRFIAGRSGVLLNNEMDDFIVKPGTPNAYGLIGQKSNAVEAGKRPLSSMSPTIITRHDKVVGVVGGSGGPTIITGTIQVILNLLHFDGDEGEVARAVDAPRIHHQWVPELLFYDDGLKSVTLEGLLMRGHTLKPWHKRLNSIQALWVWRAGERELLIGASDPSKRGKPSVVKAFPPHRPPPQWYLSDTSVTSQRYLSGISATPHINIVYINIIYINIIYMISIVNLALKHTSPKTYILLITS